LNLNNILSRIDREVESVLSASRGSLRDIPNARMFLRLSKRLENMIGRARPRMMNPRQLARLSQVVYEFINVIEDIPSFRQNARRLASLLHQLEDVTDMRRERNPRNPRRGRRFRR
jgi:hypothetical protein